MIFFEGFGSLIPYTIYLSMIWICLIFGFRTQILEVFHLSTSNKITENTSALKTYDDKIIRFFEYSKNVDNRSAKIEISKCRSNLNFLILGKFHYWKPRNSVPFSTLSDFFLYTRRGPPVVIV
jgi:hypothetical protein